MHEQVSTSGACMLLLSPETQALDLEEYSRCGGEVNCRDCVSFWFRAVHGIQLDTILSSLTVLSWTSEKGPGQAEPHATLHALRAGIK